MNTCDEDIEADDKIIAEEGERELYEHFRFVADKGQNLLRVDKFLVARLESSSRNRVQQAAEAGCILVNGKAVKSNYRVKPLDVVSVVMDRPRYEFEIIPQDIPLRCRIRRQNRLGCQQTGRIGRTPRTREL